MFHGHPNGVRRSLAKAANARVAHGVAQFFKQRLIPRVGLHQLDGLFATNAAGRALTAAFILEETQHIERRLARAVLIRKDHNGGRTDEGAERLQRVEIHRNIVYGCRQKASRGAAGLISFEGVALQHTARGVNQIHDCRTRRQQMHTGVIHAARNRIAAQTFAAILLCGRQNLWAFAHDACDPFQRLDVMHQRWPPKDTDLRHKGRTVAGQTTLALDALDHRAFFAADISARAATQIDVTLRNQTSLFQLGDFYSQDMQNRRVFVAHVDKAGFRLDRPRRDQHPLKEEMRCALQIIAVFECARLALVAVHGKVARASICAHKAPFLAGWETGTAKAAQASVHHSFLNLFPITAFAQGCQGGITTCSHVGVEAFIIRNARMRMVRGNRRLHLFGRGVVNVMMPQFQHRCGIAAAHARRAQHAHFGRI